MRTSASLSFAPYGVDRDERLVLADPHELSGSNYQEPNLFLRRINQEFDDFTELLT